MRKITMLGLAALAAAAFASRRACGGAGPPPRHVHDVRHRRVAEARGQLALGRLATAKYATNLALAKRNGYGVITQMIPDMGWHFMNPKITTFDITQAADPRVRQARLDVAARRVRVGLPEEAGEGAAAGGDVRLVRGGLPLQGRHVRVPGEPGVVRPEEPAVGRGVQLLAPDLVTLHVWLWYPNPDGVFAGMNPLMTPFNKG